MPRPSAYEPRDLLLLFLVVASFLLGDRIAVLRPGRPRHSSTRNHKAQLLEAASESKNIREVSQGDYHGRHQ